ncbi:hypothetical protein KC887_09360 [Candidatus Kaiserbacteria bacterium]|nr:hypothetical protein [Candidatus Kaiserbacteria bacterium]MCA9979194.1 hypothetical protein [Anaerolineales bacterium]
MTNENDDPIKWIRQQLQFNSETDLPDVVSGLSSILQYHERRLDAIGLSVESAKSDIERVAKEVEHNKTALLGDSGLGFAGVVQELRSVSANLSELNREMSLTRIQFDKQSAENQAELKRLSGEIKRTTVVMFVIIMVLSALILFVAMNSMAG